MNLWELHPALVHFPIALLLASIAADFYALLRKRADLAWVGAGLLVAGVFSALLAAVAGLLAFFTVPIPSDESRSRMILHLVLAASAVVLFSIEAASRWKQRRYLPTRAAVALSVIGAAMLLAAGALGGRLIMHDGVGVDVGSEIALER